MKKKKETQQKENLDAQLRLAEIMNDTPHQFKLGNRTFSITALKPGTQHLIAQEAAKIAKAEESFGDVIEQFSHNVPSVIRCLALAILNDKDKINDEKQYQALCEFIEWETDSRQWLSVLVEVLTMLNLDFFFQASMRIDLFRQLTLTNKKRSAAYLSSQQQN
jgi:hypothetical protein